MGQIVTVNFRGDDLYGFRNEEGDFVALKPIVEALGLDWSSQHKRLRRDPILNEGMVMMTIPLGRGGPQDATCLRLDLVNGWLFRLEASRIQDPTVRAKVLDYQRSAFGVLAQAFGVTREAAGSAIAPTVARDLVVECRRTFGVTAARQLWPRLGLPVVPAMQFPTAKPAQGALFSTEGGATHG